MSTWSQVVVIPGNQHCDVRNVHWLEPEASSKGETSGNVLYFRNKAGKEKKRRLVTTGLNGQAIEWSLKSLAPKARLNVNSAIWDSKMLGKFIYVAQEDGSIKVLKVKKTKIELVRSLPKVDSRCLSLAIEGADDKQPTKSLFAGYADSSIRRWDLSSGSSVLHFEKLNAKKQRKQECMMWQLRLYSGDYLVSGDSQGDVCLWDARSGTLVKRVSQLKGDVLALEVCPATRSVYASGADSRVVSLQLEEETGEWVFASVCRGQSHDVKSLLLVTPKQLLSAGVTTDVCIYNLVDGRLHEQFGKDSKQQKMAPKLRHVPPFPFRQVARADSESVCVASSRAVDVWSAATCQQTL